MNMKKNNYGGGWISFSSDDKESQEIINRVISKIRSKPDVNLEPQELLIKDLFLFIEKLISHDNEMRERLDCLEKFVSSELNKLQPK